MGKKLILVLLFLGLIGVLYFSVSDNQEDADNKTNNTITKDMVKERFCAKLKEQYGNCQKIVEIDKDSNLFFVKGDEGVIPVLSNDEFTEIIKNINMLSFQEYREELGDRGPITWQVNNKFKNGYSMVSGLVSSDVKTIIINSEEDVKPKIIAVEDDLSFWYAIFKKEKVNLPIELTGYDKNGQIIYGKNEKE